MKKLLTLLFCLIAFSAHGQVKISDLPQVSPALGTDLLPMSNTGRSTSSSYVLSVATISAYVLGMNNSGDTNLSRVSAGVVGVGTGAAGSTAGAIVVNAVTAGSLVVNNTVDGTNVLSTSRNGGPSGVGAMVTIGSGGGTNTGLKIGYSQSGYGAIYPIGVTPSTSNYALLVEAGGTLTRLNTASGSVGLAIGNNVYFNVTTTAVTPFSTGMDLGLNGSSWKRLYMDYTNTGTVGAVTINKAAGRVNIAAAGTSVVVTNSLVTAASKVFAVISQNDATAVLKNVVPAAGSFTITLSVATTAQTSIDFFVVNAD